MPKYSKTFSFIHILLPHRPFQYLPSGKSYGHIPITGWLEKTKLWGMDQWRVQQIYQRHLIQIVYMDKLLGYLFDKMKEKGIFDKSLIILVSDHGNSFKINDYMRYLSPTNYMQVLPVPLFIKTPYQERGNISDKNVETIDILPTVAHVLDIKLPQKVDGISVFEEEVDGRRKTKKAYSVYYNAGVVTYPPVEKEFPGLLEEKYEIIQDKLALFGEIKEVDDLFAMGPYRRLVGQEAENFKSPTDNNYGNQLTLKMEKKLPDSDRPNYVKGIFPAQNGIPKELHLAYAVNGIVRGVTKTYLPNKDGSLWFSFLLPESAYSAGTNQVEIYQIMPYESDRIGLIPVGIE